MTYILIHKPYEKATATWQFFKEPLKSLGWVRRIWKSLNSTSTTLIQLACEWQNWSDLYVATLILSFILETTKVKRFIHLKLALIMQFFIY